jgi:hypothetical protein
MVAMRGRETLMDDRKGQCPVVRVLIRRVLVVLWRGCGRAGLSGEMMLRVVGVGVVMRQEEDKNIMSWMENEAMM